MAAGVRTTRRNGSRVSSCGRRLVLLSIPLLSLFLLDSQANADKVLPSGFERVEGNHPAPNTAFFDQNGRQIKVQDFRGKVVIVNIWATWCAPCVKEMPSLARLAAQLPATQFAFVAVSQDKGGQALTKPFMDRLGISELSIYFDPAGRVFRDYGGRGMPTTFIIDQKGIVISRLEGTAEWDTESVKSYLLSLAKK